MNINLIEITHDNDVVSFKVDCDGKIVNVTAHRHTRDITTDGEIDDGFEIVVMNHMTEYGAWTPAYEDNDDYLNLLTHKDKNIAAEFQEPVRAAWGREAMDKLQANIEKRERTKPARIQAQVDKERNDKLGPQFYE